MKASKIVLSARRRMGLTQRQLAERTGIPQPMISAIERDRQDPRHSTLERILAVTDQEMDIVMRGGRGVDRTQFFDSPRLTPAERLQHTASRARWLQTLDPA